MDNTYNIWLLMLMGTHNPHTVSILRRFGTAENAYNAFVHGDYSFLSDEKIRMINKTDVDKAKNIAEMCDKKDIRVLTIAEDDYPARLAAIYNPPAILFTRGNISALDDEVCLAVIGTRKPSKYSMQVCKYICTELARTGAVLVSGFAVGLDTQAHVACIKNNTRTIAVMASGIDINYPAENTELKEAIINSGGAVISEVLPGIRMDGSYFKFRNRIMSGLSLGTLIIQAGERSGTLLTAEHTLQQGRDLFCIPPADIFDKSYGGVINLIRNGAIPVFNHLDIIYEYYENFSHKLSTNINHDKSDSQIFSENENRPTKKIKISGSSKENTESKNSVKPEIPYETLSGSEKAVVDALKEGSLNIDDIITKTRMLHSELCDVLMELELNGYIKSEPGSKYGINK